MRFYKDKDTGQTIKEEDLLQICSWTGQYAQYVPLTGDELTRAVIDDVIATHAPADSYKYMLLDRLRTDCGYYLGNGNRNSNTLWGGSVAAHLDAMRALYESFPEDDRPEWLTMEQIEDYAAQMIKREPTDGAEPSQLWNHSTVFQWLVYKTAPDMDGGKLVAGFIERRAAIDYLNYVKLLDRNGGQYYLKEYCEAMGENKT